MLWPNAWFRRHPRSPDSNGGPDAPEIFFWQKRPGHFNFGDHLAQVISCKLLEVGLGSAALLVDEPFRLMSIGSVLHLARDGDVVWGSGRNGKIADRAHRFQSLDVRALRGPRTHRWLATRMALPDSLPYGDPGLLFPYLFDLSSALFRPREHEVGAAVLVPNLNDVAALQAPRPQRVVLPTRPWHEVARSILAARTVVATSLHGFILAEAFGKKVRLARLSSKEPPFKYEDYSLGTGRELKAPAANLEDAEHEARAPVLRWDFAPLVRAFPFEKFGLRPDMDRLIGTLRETRRANESVLLKYSSGGGVSELDR